MPKYEVAFKLKPGCKLEERYHRQKKATEKFTELMRKFLKDNGLDMAGAYRPTERLCLLLTEALEKKLQDQLMKNKDEFGMVIFRKKSELQKKYEQDVLSTDLLCDLSCTRYWWYPCIMGGRFALWDKEGTIYGYMYSKDHEEIKLDDDMIQITLSEYYAIRDQEEAEEAPGV